MQIIIASGTLGPIYSAVLRLLELWSTQASFDGVPSMLQLVPSRRGLQILTSSLPLANYLVSSLRAGVGDSAGKIFTNHPVWRRLDKPYAPSSLSVDFRAL